MVNYQFNMPYSHLRRESRWCSFSVTLALAMCLGDCHDSFGWCGKVKPAVGATIPWFGALNYMRVGKASWLLSTCVSILSSLLTKKVMRPAISTFYLCDYPKVMSWNLNLWAKVSSFSPRSHFAMIFFHSNRNKTQGQTPKKHVGLEEGTDYSCEQNQKIKSRLRRRTEQRRTAPLSLIGLTEPVLSTNRSQQRQERWSYFWNSALAVGGLDGCMDALCCLEFEMLGQTTKCGIQLVLLLFT